LHPVLQARIQAEAQRRNATAAAKEGCLQNADSTVGRVYEQLKGMSANFQLKPGERINEVEIARQFGVSRTPLREALNRLTTEGFLSFEPGKGFFCRQLSAKDIFDLYELRKSVEVAGVQLVAARASMAEIDALMAFLESTGPDVGKRSALELVELDEKFHEQLLALSANHEMLRVLKNVNARIRFVRWIDMDRVGRRNTQSEHREVALALKERNTARCMEILERHIDRRLDQITSAVKVGYAHIYVPEAAGISST
jgi:DNA-binding GntR family transcriptional regulator